MYIIRSWENAARMIYRARFSMSLASDDLPSTSILGIHSSITTLPLYVETSQWSHTSNRREPQDIMDVKRTPQGLCPSAQIIRHVDISVRGPYHLRRLGLTTVMPTTNRSKANRVATLRHATRENSSRKTPTLIAKLECPSIVFPSSPPRWLFDRQAMYAPRLPGSTR